MFYDFGDPNIGTKDIKEILHEDGVCVLQVSYLLDTIKNMNFYDVVHEHLEYYSLQSLEFLLNKHDMDVFNIEFNNINGGSIRAYVKHKNCKKFSITNTVQKTREHEKNLGLDHEKPYFDFADRIEKLKKQK